MSVADVSSIAFICLAVFLIRFYRSRVMISSVVALTFLIHTIAVDYIEPMDGFAYYSTAVLADLAGIIVLINLSPKTKLINDACKLLLLMMCINAYGWVIYELWFTPITYNIAMGVAYLLLAIRLLITTRRDRGDRRTYNPIWNPMVRRRYSKSRH